MPSILTSHILRRGQTLTAIQELEILFRPLRLGQHESSRLVSPVQQLQGVRGRLRQGEGPHCVEVHPENPFVGGGLTHYC